MVKNQKQVRLADKIHPRYKSVPLLMISRLKFSTLLKVKENLSVTKSSLDVRSNV